MNLIQFNYAFQRILHSRRWTKFVDIASPLGNISIVSRLRLTYERKDRCFCPITAVLFEETDAYIPPHQVDKAVKLLNLPDSTTSLIILAADNLTRPAYQLERHYNEALREVAG
jgi:alkylhydroperoxidase/carboxymuconolactone decarboxylase family protein YurZ